MIPGKLIVNNVIGVMAAAMIIGPAFAHGGGLDGLGCHNDRKAANYHCHRGPLAGQHFKSRAQANDRHSATIEVTGKPRIIDGDTIAIDKQRIRLHGIDAPRPGRSAVAGKGARPIVGEWRPPPWPSLFAANP